MTTPFGPFQFVIWASSRIESTAVVLPFGLRRGLTRQVGLCLFSLVARLRDIDNVASGLFLRGDDDQNCGFFCNFADTNKMLVNHNFI